MLQLLITCLLFCTTWDVDLGIWGVSASVIPPSSAHVARACAPRAHSDIDAASAVSVATTVYEDVSTATANALPPNMHADILPEGYNHFGIPTEGGLRNIGPQFHIENFTTVDCVAHCMEPKNWIKEYHKRFHYKHGKRGAPQLSSTDAWCRHEGEFCEFWKYRNKGSYWHSIADKCSDKWHYTMIVSRCIAHECEESDGAIFGREAFQFAQCNCPDGKEGPLMEGNLLDYRIAPGSEEDRTDAGWPYWEEWRRHTGDLRFLRDSYEPSKFVPPKTRPRWIDKLVDLARKITPEPEEDEREQ